MTTKTSAKELLLIQRTRQELLSELNEAMDDDTFQAMLERRFGFHSDQDLSVVQVAKKGKCCLCGTKTHHVKLVPNEDQYICTVCQERVPTTGEFWAQLDAKESSEAQG